jgi:small subunit ribosomal protein S17
MADERNDETPPTEETTAAAPEQAQDSASVTEATAEAAGETPVAPEPVAQAAERTGSDRAEQLPPKERRRKARSTHTGQARPPRTPEERHAERQEVRRVKAVKRRARRSQERVKRAARRAAAPAAQALAPVRPPTEGARRVRQGVVVSDKADKTITVRIDVARRHRRYEKIVRSSNTLHAHDENNEAHEGDVVRVVESRPLSRTKRWRLVDVVERAR